MKLRYVFTYLYVYVYMTKLYRTVEVKWIGQSTEVGQLQSLFI